MKKKGLLDGYKTYDTTNGFGNPREWQKAFHQRMSRDEAEEILQKQQLSPHQVLGIPENASKSEIRKAFRKLIMEWHPDHNAHRIEEAEAQSLLIIAAFSTLSEGWKEE